jgi:DNA recombination protein RmuC
MSLLRDARMREQAHVIQKEVVMLMGDVARLDERVRKLQLHYTQATSDIDSILVSTRKITGRGAKIDSLDFSQTPARTEIPAEPDDEPPELFRRLEGA